MALRGRFLVGSRPVSDDLVRRFILSAAESGIDIFRLHDPLNDVENLAAGGRRRARGRAAAVRRPGLLGPDGEPRAGGREGPPAGRAGRRPRAAARPRRRARPGHVRPASSTRLARGVRRAGRASTARARAATRWRWRSRRPAPGPSRSRPRPTRWPRSLNRVAAEVLCEALTGLGLEHGVDADRVWDGVAVHRRRTSRRSMPALPIPPRIALRTALNRLPVGLVAEHRRPAARGRMRPTAWTRCWTSSSACATTAACPRWPSRSAASWPGRRCGTCSRRAAGPRCRPRCATSSPARTGRRRWTCRAGGGALADCDGPAERARPTWTTCGAQAGGAPSEEDLLLLALFGDDAARLLEAPARAGRP